MTLIPFKVSLETRPPKKLVMVPKNTTQMSHWWSVILFITSNNPLPRIASSHQKKIVVVQPSTQPFREQSDFYQNPDPALSLCLSFPLEVQTLMLPSYGVKDPQSVYSSHFLIQTSHNQFTLPFTKLFQELQAFYLLELKENQDSFGYFES